jgi:hypothetical protein
MMSELLVSELLVSELLVGELPMTRGASPPIGWIVHASCYGALLRNFPSVLYQVDQHTTVGWESSSQVP